MGQVGGIHGFTAPLTSFVGRVAEVSELAELLAAHRMVTVTGAGGMGKTRLAREISSQVAGQFADGAWLAELAAVQDGSLVPAATAAALGVPQEPSASVLDSLTAALARQQLLLVLDNCEQVLDAAAALCRAVLLAADDVRVLATSREPLRVAGEVRYRLQPFPVPAPGAPAGSDAMVLFADRARQADPHFRVDDHTAPLVAQIVTQLDGMPLAIELAAARAEALGLDQLAARLDRSLRLLASSDRAAEPRHQSLAATVQWSYRLLSGPEQQVFRRLAVFPGPFTLDAALDVAGAGAEAAVLHLVDCSLLLPPRTGLDGRGRYLMLQVLRAFGREQLTGQDEEAASRALARYALAVAEAAAAAMRLSSAELSAARWLDAEDAALRQGLDWCQAHDHDAALRLAIALTPWWNIRGRHTEASAQLSAAVQHAVPGTARWSEAQYCLGQSAKTDLPAALAHYQAASEALGHGPPSGTLACALAGQANLLNIFGRREGVTLAAQALSVARDVSDPCAEVFALLDMSQALTLAGDLDGALGWAREASRIDPETIPGDFARDCWTNLTVVLVEVGELAAARESCGGLLALARQAGDLVSEAVGLFLLADLELRAGRLAEATEQLRPAVRMALELRHRIQLIVCLPIGAELCALAGRWADAVTLYAAHMAACESGGQVTGSAYTAARRDELTRRAAAELAVSERCSAQQRGTAMTLDTAAEFLLLAIAPGQQAQPSTAEPPRLQDLSAREQELVTLVARGRTDAQIATDLYISVSTVRSHLDRIRDKTSCRRRADLTRLALHAGLA